MRLMPLVLVLLTMHVSFAIGQDGTISGRVTDASGAPVARAVIVLKVELTGAQQVLQTDSQGRYEASGLTSQSYIVEASFETLHAERKVFVQPGARLPLDLILSAPPTGWVLPPSGTV